MEFIGLSTIFTLAADTATSVNWEGFIPELNFIAKFIQWMYSWIGNYGWTVVVFTVLLKILTFPLDIWQRVLAKKNAIITKELQPLLANVDKQYPNNPQQQNAEKQKLMKKMGYSPASSCLPLLVTMAIFMVMFSGLNSYSAYINVQNYVDLEAEYLSTYDAAIAEGKTAEEAIEIGKDAVVIYFEEEIQEPFLWINNIWRPDTWENIMIDANSFESGGSGLAALEDGNPLYKPRYNTIRDAVLEGNPGYFASYNDDGSMARNDDGSLKAGWNGLILLPILAMGIMFLSSWISQKQNSTSASQSDPSQKSAKMMMFMMPIIFGIFGFFYTAAFSVYLVSNSLWSVLINLATNGWVNNLAAKSAEKKRILPEKASYKR